jgi:hypothetical protein
METWIGRTLHQTLRYVGTGQARQWWVMVMEGVGMYFIWPMGGFMVVGWGWWAEI